MTVTSSSSIRPTRDDGAWTLSKGDAMRLPIGPGPRELRVLEGRVWITQQGALQLPSDDYWLEAGDALDLPSGTELVVEAWPSARFQLLVTPASCPATRARRGLTLSSFGQRLATA
ncbi:DUF2917 domain-containing protein [Roseateles amylovorans]|uniref:DUF2917 domain-containing protein n=1 Tax=Roseateles amylovorans TaxID=2978473 RepID=A0ABY6B0U0_9BURK|nr:DUF2917 domain-containing protein [Roseateles amylovorans]UXH79019.1 DUF2917 domain-containing protein [Roseateles amylovorans]